MVSDRTLRQQAVANAAAVTASNTAADLSQGTSNGNAFYFYNTNAVSQGYADFKRKWGNRKLEDNWRRSDRTPSGEQANNQSVAPQNIDPDAPLTQAQTGRTVISAGNYRQELLQGLPLNPAMISQSNLRIYNAYMDIGNFYRDVLSDKKEAITNYEYLLNHYPDDPNKAAVYYNLYRLYGDVDSVRAGRYKNILLKNYAETPFAKIISDPDYIRKLDDVNTELTKAYNVVFDLYARKQYKEVLACVPEVVKQYPGNIYLAQLYYLQTLAAGHNEGLIPFKDSLLQIVKKFPYDRLIVPLINQHLAYINTNQAELMARAVVLTDDDPTEVPFTFDPALREQAAYRRPIPKETLTAKQENKKPAINTAKPVQPPKAPPPVQQQSSAATAPTQQAVTTRPNQPIVKQPEVSSIFSMRDSSNYYFVVHVSTATINLSSSRFGIGQFNRANYQGKGIKHQLLPVGQDDQLIYVGRFATLAGVKKYAQEIIPLMPDIMKVPKDKYSFFIITQENLDKLADKKTLDSYIDYYQKNY